MSTSYIQYTVSESKYHLFSSSDKTRVIQNKITKIASTVYWQKVQNPYWELSFLPAHLRTRSRGLQGLLKQASIVVPWPETHVNSCQFSPTTLTTVSMSGSWEFIESVNLTKGVAATPKLQTPKCDSRHKHSVWMNRVNGWRGGRRQQWGGKIIKSLDGGCKDSLLNRLTYCLSWPGISMQNMWETICGRQQGSFSPVVRTFKSGSQVSNSCKLSKYE